MADIIARTLTPLARVWLRATTSARVLGVFERACNLVNQDDALLTLVTAERGLTPFAVVVVADGHSPFRDITSSSRVSVEAGRLRLGPLDIACGAAKVWNPVPDWPAVRSLLADQPACVSGLADVAAELAPPGSLLDLYRPSPSGTARAEVMLDRAGRGAEAIAHGLTTRSLERCLTGARALAGLGGGLTPAGDDFVVGILLAIRAGLFGNVPQRWSQTIAETAAGRTTTLSAAYLRAAARGECAVYWHALIESMLRQDAVAGRSAVGALLAVGHTSGADALAGFLAPHILPEKAL
jgi:hypothetical protein